MTSTFGGGGFADLSVLADEEATVEPEAGSLGVELATLRGADRRGYIAALSAAHQVAVRVVIMNLEGDRLSHLDPVAVDGQVNLTQGETTRSLTLTLFDPHHDLNMDSQSPGNGSLYRDRMIRVSVGVLGDGMRDWVWTPVFTGPLVKFDRNEDIVNIEAHGKETLARRGAQGSSRVGRKARKDSAIRKLMADRTGETRFDLGECNSRLHRPVSLSATDETWRKVQRIARSADRQLFYTAAGVLRLRRPSDNVAFTFTDDHLLSAPLVSDQPDKVRNRVTVVGRKPKPKKNKDDDESKKGGGKKPRGRAVLPRRHPLSAQKLGRNGAPSYIDEKVTNNHVRSKKEADRLAERVLRDKSEQVIAVSFDSIPVYHLEPGDLVRVQSKGFDHRFRLDEFSLPLFVGEGEGSPMSVGYTRKVSTRRGRIR